MKVHLPTLALGSFQRAAVFTVCLLTGLGTTLIAGGTASAASPASFPTYYALYDDGGNGWAITDEGVGNQVKTTDAATLFHNVNGFTVYGTEYVEIEVYGTSDCLEYAGTVASGYVRVEPCVIQKASELWYPDGDPSTIWENYYGDEIMYADGLSDGAKVDANQAPPDNSKEYTWDVIK